MVKKSEICVVDIDMLVKKEKQCDKPNTKIIDFHCESCDKTFGRKYDLQRHNRNFHVTENNVHNCQVCDMQFATKTSLDRHTISIHQNPQHKCKTCEKMFKRKDTLQRHIKNVHNTEYITCKFCKQKLCTREYYERHLKNCLINQVLHQYPGSSKWERFVSKYFVDNNINFQFQHKYPDLKSSNNVRLAYDFYVPEKKLLVEINGKQHYQLTNYTGAKEIFDRNQLHDAMKLEYAQQNDIELLIIDTRKENTMELIHKILATKIEIRSLILSTTTTKHK